MRYLKSLYSETSLIRTPLGPSPAYKTEPSYTSDDIAPYKCIYEYTVTLRSKVEGASNGTSLTVIGVLGGIVIMMTTFAIFKARKNTPAATEVYLLK